MIAPGEGACGTVRALLPRGPRQAPAGAQWGGGVQVRASLALPPGARLWMHKGKERTRRAPAPAEAVTWGQPLRLPARPRGAVFSLPGGLRLGCAVLMGGLSLILDEQMAQGRDIN